MKKLIKLVSPIFLLVISTHSFSVIAQKKECIDFDNPSGNIANWIPMGITNLMFLNQPGYGNVLNFKDASGASVLFNNIDFTGNWLKMGEADCFCFDYKVDWNSVVPTNPVYGPNISLYNGPSLTTIPFGFRAAFVPNTAGTVLPDNTWSHFCLPIGLCQGGSLPSNTYGTWVISNVGIPLLGSAACTAWNNIIQGVTGIAFGADYNNQPSEIINFDNFCWKCDSIETISCCPGENRIKNGDFENGNAGFISKYSYQSPPSANSVLPGMFSILNSTTAANVSSTWALQDHNCSPTGNFMVVNGSTGQSGPKLVWEQAIPVKPNTEYRFCAWVKDLKQCSFNVLPNIEIKFTPLPPGIVIQNNTIVNSASALCVWQRVTQIINTGASTSVNIQIWLDEVLIGDGNDLAIDDIVLTEVGQFPPGSAQFNIATTWINPTTFNILATPIAILPANSGCGFFWEVCEIDNLGNCLSGTIVTNPSQWWTGSMTFSGYIGTGNLSGTSPGVFLDGHRYKIKYGIWCECKSWMQLTVLLEFNRSMRKPKITAFQELQLDSHRPSTE